MSRDGNGNSGILPSTHLWIAFQSFQSPRNGGYWIPTMKRQKQLPQVGSDRIYQSCSVLRKGIAVSSTKCESTSTATADRTSTKLKGKEKAEESEADEEATSTSDVEGEEVEADDTIEEVAASAASKK